MKKLFSAPVFIMLFSMLAFSQIATAQKFYVTVEGSTQGNIKGDVAQKGREGKIAAVGYIYSASSPKDPATGMATGRRSQTGITITKAVEISSPKLYAAMINNENLKTVTLEFWAPNVAGVEYKYYSIKLTNASISRISQYAGVSNPDKTGRIEGLVEEITFTFQKIEMSNLVDGSTVADSWNK